MKKFLRRIFELMITFSCLFYNFCYADVIVTDPITGEKLPSAPHYNPNIEPSAKYSVLGILLKWGEIFVVLIVISIIVALLIYSIFKAIKKNNNEVNDEEKDNDNL